MERTIGRNDEVVTLNESVSKASASTSIVHGLHGVGKTHLMRHWFEQSFNSRGRKAWYTCNNPLAHTQDFIKGLSRELLLQLNPEEQNLINLLLKNRYGSDFDLLEWVWNSQDDGLRDGYVFLEILKAAKSADETGILMIIDEAELLSAESRRLLRLIAEWKPLGTYLYINVATQTPGRQGLAEQGGGDWFFKGTTYIEVHPLEPQHEARYLELWSIKQTQKDVHFMDHATYQKRAWVCEQAEESTRIRSLLCSLAHFPYGLPHRFNPKLEEFEDLLQDIPELQEILRRDETVLAFSDLNYIEDLQNRFPQDFTQNEIHPLQDNSDWHLLQKTHKALSQEQEDVVRVLGELACFYARTHSLTPLKELLESAPVFGEHQKLWLQTLELSTQFNEEKAPSIIQKVVEISDEHPRLLDLIIATLARCRCLHLLFKVQHPKAYSFLRTYLFQAAEYHPEETLNCLESMELEPALKQEACIMVQWFFLDGELQSSQKFIHWPLAGEFAHAIREHEQNQNTEALKRLVRIEPQALRSGERHLHSRVLERISAVNDTLGNFDARLSAYRDAVISSVFSP